MVQHIAHIVFVCRFEQKAADKDLQGFQRIFRVLRHYDQVAARLQLLDHARQCKAVHARHFQIQKRRVHRPLTHPAQRIIRCHGADIITIRRNTAEDTDQRVNRKLSIIDDQYLHAYSPASSQ